MNKILKIVKRRFDPDTNQCIRLGIDRIRSARQHEYTTTRDLFGRVQYVEMAGSLFVPVVDSSRPPRGEILVCFEMRPFCPTISEEDRDELFHLMKLTTIQDAVTYHELVHLSYGQVEKGCVPTLITCRDDAKAIGLDFDNSISCHLNNGDSVFWQEWGGDLVSLTVKPTAKHPFGNRIIIGTHVGNFRKLPYSQYR